MKNQALFSSKDKSKKLKCHLLQFLFGALRVKSIAFMGNCKYCEYLYSYRMFDMYKFQNCNLRNLMI